MSLSWHLLAFIVAICLLVTVHEFGHFSVARLLGFKVLRFSVGFGKTLWSHVAGADRTEYVIAAVPLGGYVKMLDEREGPVAAAELSRAFNHRPHWQRIVVLLAGPAFNIIFAVLLLTAIMLVAGITEARPVLGPIDAASIAGRAGLRAGDEIVAVDARAVDSQRAVLLDLLDAVSGGSPVVLTVRNGAGAPRTSTLAINGEAERRRLTEPSALMSGLGLEFYEPPVPPVLGSVESNGPAARAGLQAGDTILAIDAQPVHDFQNVVTQIQSRPGQRISIQYRRRGVDASVQVSVLAQTQDGRTVGRILARPPPLPPYPESLLRHTRLSLPGAFVQANVQAWDMTALQGRLFWRMLIGRVSVKNLSGPVGIAELAGDSASLGVAPFLYFLVIVSLALGFMNLLPIPLLDGGQILFQTIEWLKGSPLSERIQAIGQQLGIALLVLLLGVTLFNDISRQFG
ncbi:MAG TPA: RIP metalloprotease RseP [Steroidobacteraceae bacterium]